MGFTRQPQYVAQVDPRRVARGGILYAPNSPRDLISGMGLTANVAARSAYGDGVGAQFSGSTSERVEFTKNLTGDLTIVSSFRLDALGGAAVCIAGVFNPSGSANGHYLSVESNGNVSVISTSSDNWTTATGPTHIPGKVYRAVAVFTAGGGRKLFIDGALAASDATARTPSGLTSVLTGLYTANNVGFSPMKGAIGINAFLPYAVSDAEAMSLSFNPWQIFASPVKRFFAPPSGTTISADGSTTGSATVSGTSQAIWKVDGSSVGLASIASSTNAIWRVDGSSIGSASILGSANAIWNSDGSASGVGTLSAVANAIAQVTGSSSGTSIVDSVTNLIFSVDGSSNGVGTGTATTVNIAQVTGAAIGSGTAVASGVSITTSNGSSTGVATLAGSGNAIWVVNGSSAGIATVSGITDGSSIANTDGSSSGTSTSGGQGQSIAQAIAAAYGSGVASGTGVMIAASVGASSGTSSNAGIANALWASNGFSAGVSTAQSTVIVIFQAAGFSVGTSTIDAVTSAIKQAVGNSTGSCTVHGVTEGGVHYTASGDKFNITVVFAPYAIRLSPSPYAITIR